MEKRRCRAPMRYASTKGCLAAMKPPITEKALDRLPISMSTNPSNPKWLTTPRLKPTNDTINNTFVGV